MTKQVLLIAFGNRTYPVGLAEIYSFLNQRKYDVDFIHLFGNVNKLDEILYVPDYVGITCITIERKGLDKVVNAVRSKWPKTRIILGGRHFSEDVFDLEQRLYNKVDYVVYGEGEYAMVKILNDEVDNKIIYVKK